MGIFFTPFLFLRTFLRAGSPIRNKKVRRRIWMEFAAHGSRLGGDPGRQWLSPIRGNTSSGCMSMPAWLAANMQSLRKYIEHVGLTGSTVNSSTRSIVADGWLANFVTFTLLHEPYHGVHHWRSGLPHPDAAACTSSSWTRASRRNGLPSAVIGAARA